MTEPKDISFICDDNLGKLSRYLRTGGYDTYFDSRISNSDLIKIALDDNRIILTRDHSLIEQTLVRRYFLVEDDDWRKQLLETVRQFKLQYLKANMFSRCLIDNTPTIYVEKESIKESVYPYTYQVQENFKKCPECNRVYWPGTHVLSIIERLQKIGIKVID